MGSLSLPRAAAAASAPVEYSRVQSSDMIEDGSLEIEYLPPKLHRSGIFLRYGSLVASVVGILALCSLLLLAIHEFERPRADRSPQNSGRSVPAAAPSSSDSSNILLITSATLCNDTQDPAFCVETATKCPGLVAGQAVSLPNLTAFVVAEVLDALNGTLALATDLIGRNSTGSPEMAVLQECAELLEGAMDAVKGAVDMLHHLDAKEKVRDVRVSLSTAYSDEETCWDDFDADAPPDNKVAKQMLYKGSAVTSLLGLALYLARIIEDRMPLTVYIGP